MLANVGTLHNNRYVLVCVDHLYMCALNNVIFSLAIQVQATHEDITDKASSTTTTFIVSSSQTSPEYDMCVSVTINGGQTPHTVTVERKASKRFVCQVFYHWEGINRWKTTFAFFPEHLLDVSNYHAIYILYRVC